MNTLKSASIRGALYILYPRTSEMATRTCLLPGPHPFFERIDCFINSLLPRFVTFCFLDPLDIFFLMRIGQLRKVAASATGSFFRASAGS